MATHHKIDAIRSGCWNGMDWDAEYVITFAYRPGAPDRPYLRNGDPGYPGYPAEVEFISVEHDPRSAGEYITAQDLADWAEEWLEEHFADCVEIAESYDERVSG